MSKYDFFEVPEEEPEEVKVPEKKEEVKKEIYECQYCNRSFSSKRGRSIHESSCTKNPDLKKEKVQVQEQKLKVKDKKINSLEEKIDEMRDDIKNLLKTVKSKQYESYQERTELNEENMLDFVKSRGKTKPYEARIFFDYHDSKDITKVMHRLVNHQKLKRDKNGWYSLNKN
jgi:DNA anti-recombination protein RmuC